MPILWLSEPGTVPPSASILDDMSEEEAAAELDEIRADDAAADMGSAPPAETENESFEEKPPEELLPGGDEA